MSIVAAVKVYDGIVMGADSATITTSMMPGQMPMIKSYQNAQKLFRIDELKIATLTWGVGNIGDRSLASIISEFNKDIASKFTTKESVEQIADELFKFVSIKYKDAFAPIIKQAEVQPHARLQILGQIQLGFFIAGYSENDIVAQEWEFLLPFDTKIKKVKEQFAFGVDWRGITIPFDRLYRGYDPRLIDELIKKFNLKLEEVKKIILKYATPIQYNGMPLQDAVDFLNHVLLTTINNTKFEVGIATCGEPIDLIVITNKEYKIIKAKNLNF